MSSTQIADKVLKRSSTTITPPNLLFAEMAFSDVAGIKRFYIGDASETVYLIELSDWGLPSKDLDLNGQKITNIANAVAITDVPSWGQVQNLIQGLKWQDAVKVAVDSNINISNPGTTIFDGINFNINETLLLKGQTNLGENGVFQFNGFNAAMTRIDRLNTLAKIDTAAVLVDQGTYANKGFVLQVDNINGTLGTEAIEIFPFVSGTIDPILQSISALTPNAGDILYYNGSGYSNFSPTPGSIISVDGAGNLTSIVGNDNETLIKSGGVWTTQNHINVMPLERVILVANYQLTVNHKMYQFIDPGGSDRDVLVPTSPIFGMTYVIRNVGLAANLLLKEATTLIGTLGSSGLNDTKDGQEVHIIYDGVNWECNFFG